MAAFAYIPVPFEDLKKVVADKANERNYPTWHAIVRDVYGPSAESFEVSADNEYNDETYTDYAYLTVWDVNGEELKPMWRGEWGSRITNDRSFTVWGGSDSWFHARELGKTFEAWAFDYFGESTIREWALDGREIPPPNGIELRSDYGGWGEEGITEAQSTGRLSVHGYKPKYGPLFQKVEVPSE